jgi:flagellar biosynthetic protein FliR
MPALVELSGRPLMVFLFVLARVSGLVLTAPALGAPAGPKPVRLVLAVALALLIAPVFCDAPLPEISRPWQLLVPLCREAVLGLVMGLALMVLVAGMQSAGHVIGQMSGMSLAATVDPDTGSNSPLLGRLFGLVAIVIFLLIGGHRQLLAALLDTFHWMPPGRVGFSSGLVMTLSEITAQSFVLTLRATIPVMLALLMTALTLGLVARALPQLNVLAVGLGLNAMIALAVMSVSLGVAAWAFQEHVEAAMEAVRTALGSVRAGSS